MLGSRLGSRRLQSLIYTLLDGLFGWGQRRSGQKECAHYVHVRGLVRAVCEPFTFHFESESILKHDTILFSRVRY